MTWLLPAFILTMSPFPLAAQPTTGARGSENEPVLRNEGQGRSTTMGDELPPVERAINPDLYYLGPNDQLLLALPILEGGEFPIVVSLDNTILLPRGFPLITVKGMTLSRLRRVVDSLYMARSSSYRNASVSLVRPRSIYVTVSGDVLVPGRYIITAADRVTTAIDMASVLNENLTRQEQTELIEAQGAQRARLQSSPGLGGISSHQVMTRWVTLRHNDGTSTRLDLARYRSLGVERENPTLREGDEVIVHPVDPTGPTVAVAGAVNAPMVIPYNPGDNALLLARLSAGLRQDANPQEAFLTRQGDGAVARTPIDLEDSAALASLMLQPGDQLVVLAAESPVTGARSGVGVVSVRGEVMRPSIYPIVPGTTTLSDVIAQAGGVTSEAALNGAYITRAVDISFDLKETTRDPGAYISASSLALDDTTRMKFDLENQQNRVSADFVEVIARGNKGKDVPLQNGDEIVIPSNPKHVFIRGRVLHPGWVAYAPGSPYEYYVEKAGGFTDAAVEGRIQVRKYGTGIWEAPDRTTIMPGDEIYIPGERDLPARTPLEIAGTIISITSGILAIAYSIFSFVRDLTRDP